MKINDNKKKDKTEYTNDIPLPIGYKKAICPKCGSKNLTGALITENSDEQDPNILCKNCGYWFD